MKIPGLPLLVGIAALLVWIGCGKPAVPPAEHADYGSVRDQVVHKIKTGEIKLNDAGVAMLAPDFASASVNGQVVAAQTPATGWVVAFPLQEGRAAIQCLVYVETTAPPAGQSLQVGSMSIVMGQETEKHWYQGALKSN
jgi:hypothetical protein